MVPATSPGSAVHRVPVRHAGGQYDVVIGPGVLARLGPLAAERLPGRRLALVTDETILPRLAAWGAGAVGELRLTVPPGEEAKSRERWSALTDALLEAGFGRDSALVAIGGGVVGDLAGFVAATYLRGIPFVLAPTTLLAMVDASVGGKVGVDTPRGKNLVGAFHPPALVVADPLVLGDLSPGVFRAGLAEAIKHGLIADAEYFAWLESAMDAILAREPAALTHLVSRSVELKAAIVEEDEHESGRRAILNAGHTVAHALERVSNWTLPHGEAVALGLLIEGRLAEQLGVLPSGVLARLAALLARAGLPVRLEPSWRADRIVEAARLDKKNRAGAIRCSLPGGLGRAAEGQGAAWTTPIDPSLLREALAAQL